MALAAFPGAQGAGATSAGGRGGTVMYVTNLNDSGAGSLRAACTTAGARIILFSVGGTINLATKLIINQPNCSIFGQTAPGGGILLSFKTSSDADDWCVQVASDTDDVIIQYLRVRVGFKAGRYLNQKGSGIFISSGCQRVMVDHCSVSWWQDDGHGVWSNTNLSPISEVTFSHNLVAEGLADHATAGITGATNQATMDLVTDVDYHHSLMMHNTHRQPHVKHKSGMIVNNIIYNAEFRWIQGMGGGTFDIIGNKAKLGPASTGYADAIHLIHWVPQTQAGADGPSGTASIYLAGNLHPTHVSNPDADNWDVLIQKVCGENQEEATGSCPTTPGILDSATHKRVTPRTAQTWPITIHAVTALEAYLLPHVGASRRLNSVGKWVYNRDAVDTRLITEYNAGTGTNGPADETVVGGYPTIDPGVAYVDTNGDGIPDEYGALYGVSSGSATAPNGYTYLDNFLQGLPDEPPFTISNMSAYVQFGRR